MVMMWESPLGSSGEWNCSFVSSLCLASDLISPLACGYGRDRGSVFVSDSKNELAFGGWIITGQEESVFDFKFDLAFGEWIITG